MNSINQGSNTLYMQADIIIGFDEDNKAVIVKDRQKGKNSRVLILASDVTLITNTIPKKAELK
jgi:hypothetical protein